jgi:hypothetical protein
LAVRKSLAARKRAALVIPSRTSMSRVIRASDVVLMNVGGGVLKFGGGGAGFGDGTVAP